MSSVLFDIPGPKARARHRLIMIVSVGAHPAGAGLGGLPVRGEGES
jgi:hypothetical protein